ncbi:hypothetical protein DM02DRAFT_701071 [Periconia macrospinosa]|uniref:Uncharacterized protein n=1 Tax=Periconia macrospinosa TaxID=97972 RepID=A0A2V1D2F7_9PLEO|nr:hypothetical protein DM02DRAFT_701071 [Periconia macrospinosa]
MSSNKTIIYPSTELASPAKTPFLLLTPADSTAAASTAIRLPENQPYYQTPPKYISTVRPPNGNEPGYRTPEYIPEDNQENTMSDHEGILLSMQDETKDPSKGWVFRTDISTSDIVLGYNGTAGISRQHFAILIDIQGRNATQSTRSYFGRRRYRNKVYPQKVAWKRGPRRSSINPIGLDRTTFRKTFNVRAVKRKLGGAWMAPIEEEIRLTCKLTHENVFRVIRADSHLQPTGDAAWSGVELKRLGLRSGRWESARLYIVLC